MVVMVAQQFDALNCTLKNGENGKFYVYMYLTTIKKILKKLFLIFYSFVFLRVFSSSLTWGSARQIP